MVALLCVALPPARACEPALAGEAVRRVTGSDYVLAWRPQPAPIRQGAFFAVEVAACARRGGIPAELRVDAVMPEHRHGMNYRPRVSARGEGRFTAEGLLLHMPGRWEFRFDLRGEAGSESLRDSLWLP
ncbi:MAG: hypothetical protein N2688_09585 [Burkholderiaceae bacterium]|nr:hypothetical protein [Burkholderiaceae bacterium]